ncbi:DNA helicase, partial [Tanacetum coccineum]
MGSLCPPEDHNPRFLQMYRRRNDGRFVMKNELKLDNSYVELIVSEQGLPDPLASARYICPHEAAQRIFSFDIHELNPAVQSGGVRFPNYRSACEAFGLLGDHKEWAYAFDEASEWASAHELRTLFAHMLRFCEISDPIALWSQKWRRMSDDIQQRAAADVHIVNLHVNDGTCRIMVALAEDHAVLVSKLNTNQNMIYTSVLEAYSEDKQVLMFVYGHGIASLLLPPGRTAHSRFKIPLYLTNDSICHIKKNTQLAQLLTETALIIWDEAPMNDRPCFESLDKTLRDILDEPTRPFGGKSVLLGGDFPQTLPVKPKGTKMDIVSSSIAKSSLWRHFRICAQLSYNNVHNEAVRSGLRMAIVQQSMEMNMWEIKEKLAERREQMAIRAYEEEKRHAELNQKIEEDKRREAWNQKIEEMINLIE